MNRPVDGGAPGGPEFAGLSAAQLLCLDRLCREFELALGGGTALSVEQTLAMAEGQIKPFLFRELLYQELSHPSHRHVPIDRSVYETRFPDYGPQIAEVWEALRPLASTPADASRSSGTGAAETLPGLAIPGYEIQARLARGGMGVVYRARDLTLGREVAIKMLSFDRITRDESARFLAEAQAIGSLRHPHVIQIHSAGDHFGQPYLVLEYAACGTLQERLDAGPWPRDKLLDVFLPLVETLAFIHGKGKLHRDLKPSNILFDADGTLKISDFGLVKDLTAATELTLTQTQPGTPAYMAPEQVDSRFGKVSERSDIFSLGVLLHVLLTGVTPYHGMNATQLLKALASDEAVPATQLRQRRVGSNWRRICLRCLEKQPQHRYRSAQALLADLRRLHAGKAVSALPLGLKYVAPALRAAALGALLLGGGAWLWRPGGAPLDDTGFAGGRVIGNIDPAVLAALNSAYAGPEDFLVLPLLGGAGATEALALASPQGLALHEDRWLAVADALGHRVLVIDLVSGEISQVAGSGQAAYSGDGQAAALADLNLPAGLDFDEDGNLFVADRGNHAVRRIGADGTIATVLGGFGCEQARGTDGRPVITTLCYPGDVSTGSGDELYVADSYNRRIQYWKAGQNESTAAVLGSEQYIGTLPDDGFSPMPRALAFANDSLHFIEGHEGRLQRRAPDGSITTLAEGFVQPMDISVDARGALYVSDLAGWPLSRVDPASGEVSVLARTALGDARRVGALAADQALGSGGRVFFADLQDRSIKVLIPSPQSGELPLQPHGAIAVHTDSRVPENLHRDDVFYHIETPLKEVYTDLAYRLGLHPFIHASIDLAPPFNFARDTLSPHQLLVLTCFGYGVACAIDGNTLFVAPADALPALTAAPPIKIEQPLTLIDNWEAMPVELQAEAQRRIVLSQGGKRFQDEFFHMLEELSRLRFEIDPAMAGYQDAVVDMDGEQSIGDMLAVFISLRKISVRYDADSGRLVVSPWRDQQDSPA